MSVQGLVSLGRKPAMSSPLLQDRRCRTLKYALVKHWGLLFRVTWMQTRGGTERGSALSEEE